ncbi:NOT2 [Auxenochlorella protothecoides x Auxenochlorella symbiontica]
MDGRYAQFHAGQGVLPGYGGLPNNMQGLQGLQGAATAGYGLQGQLQGGRSGMPGMNAPVQGNQRMAGLGLNPGLAMGLGQNPRVNMAGAQQAQHAAHTQYGMAQRAQQGAPQQLGGLGGGLGGRMGGGGAAAGGTGAYPANLAMFQRGGQALGAHRGLGGRLGALGGGAGYVAPSGDLLTMLSKAAGQAAAAQAGAAVDGGDGGVQGGGGAASALDSAEFPTLGGAQAQGPGAAAARGMAAAQLAQLAQQQQQYGEGGDASFAALLGMGPGGGTAAKLQQQQGGGGGASPGVGFQEEEFPALPGTMARGPAGAQQAALQAMLAGVGPNTKRGQQVAAALQQQQQAAAAAAQAQAAAAAQAAATAAQVAAADPAAADAARYGLLGLVDVIRTPESDASSLALGFDLTSLGLSLNSAEPIWKEFGSPWGEPAGKVDAEFKTPACYQHNPLRLSQAYFSKFQPDTLFYVFYGMPGEDAQVLAAEELTNRGWYFHKELQAWLTMVPGTEPTQKTDRFERGAFFVFEPATWEVTRKDNFVVHFEHLERAPPLPGRSQPGLQTRA